MALPLNIFKTVAEEAPAAATSVYTSPTGYSSIVLLAQVCNTDAADATFTLNHIRDGVETAIVYEYSVPENETLVLTSGRLVLETGDELQIVGSTTNLKFIASILETLK